MISQAVEYSLRAMVMLANAGEEPLTVRKIAVAAKIPAPYLSKLMQALLRAELVYSRRGVGGGFTLGRAAKEVTVWDIVQAVDPIKRILACPLGITGHVRLCPLHRRLDQAMALVEEAFRKSSLALKQACAIGCAAVSWLGGWAQGGALAAGGDGGGFGMGRAVSGLGAAAEG